MKIAPTVVLSLVVAGTVSRAEPMWYDFPYLGHPTASIFGYVRDVAASVQQSDLVFIGTTKPLDTSAYDGITGKGSYTATVALDTILKGTFAEAAIALTWKPSATGIRSGSKHIFFIRDPSANREIIKEIFIHEPRWPWCRTYGAMDGGLVTTLGAISYFISPQAGLPPNYSDALLNDLKDASGQLQATAVGLAYELMRPECLPALLFAVTNHTDDYLLAIYTACRLDGNAGAKAALTLLNVPPGNHPIRKSDVFYAITVAKNPTSVAPLKQLGDNHPQHRVSCAFAIRQVSPTEAAPIIKAWLADHKHDGMSVTIGPYYARRPYSYDSLLTLVLDGKELSKELLSE